MMDTIRLTIARALLVAAFGVMPRYMRVMLQHAIDDGQAIQAARLELILTDIP